jgi:hypothetical protein
MVEGQVGAARTMGQSCLPRTKWELH